MKQSIYEPNIIIKYENLSISYDFKKVLSYIYTYLYNNIPSSLSEKFKYNLEYIELGTINANLYSYSRHNYFSYIENKKLIYLDSNLLNKLEIEYFIEHYIKNLSYILMKGELPKADTSSAELLTVHILGDNFEYRTIKKFYLDLYNKEYKELFENILPSFSENREKFLQEIENIKKDIYYSYELFLKREFYKIYDKGIEFARFKYLNKLKKIKDYYIIKRDKDIYNRILKIIYTLSNEKNIYKVHIAVLESINILSYISSFKKNKNKGIYNIIYNNKLKF